MDVDIQVIYQYSDANRHVLKTVPIANMLLQWSEDRAILTEVLKNIECNRVELIAVINATTFTSIIFHNY